MNRRVVITGMGAITPIGNSVDEFCRSLKEGKNGIDYITRFDTEGFKVKIAAEVKNFDTDLFMPKKETKRMDLFSQFALGAATEAVNDSGLDVEALDKKRFGVAFSSGIGGLGTIESEVIKLSQKGPNRVSPLFIPMAIINLAAGNIAIRFGARSNCISMVTACSSATSAIGEALRSIRHGYSDVIIAGGTEASVTKIGIAGFTSITALCERNDIDRASIPYDHERCGFVLGEGAGALIIEEYEHAKRRGAKIYAEVLGYGATCDAYHMTAPLPDGEGAAEAMREAVSDAGINMEDIQYINAHGTSTPQNDQAETAAIKSAFGAHAYNMAISSTKSMTGHLLGAAGAIEAIASVLAINKSFAPPTLNLNVPDPECDLFYVPNKAKEMDIKYAISNSFGFGGHNAVICLGRVD